MIPNRRGYAASVIPEGVLVTYCLKQLIFTKNSEKHPPFTLARIFKTRAFTLEQYKALPRTIRQKFRDAYNGMNVSADNIKN